MKTKESCKGCNRNLWASESESRILYMCRNPRCDNYWMKEGCEILMVLK